MINLLRERLLAYDIIQMDETTVQVLTESDKWAQFKSYLWVQRGGPPEQTVILYDYDPGRGSGVPTRLLEGFRSYLQTDGYNGYNAVIIQNDLVHVGCMAHAQRKFSEAIKAQGKKKKKTGKAQQGLSFIQKLYHIEKQVKDLSPEERYQQHQKKSVPVLNKLHAWLEASLEQVLPTTAVGKALKYLHNECDVTK